VAVDDEFDQPNPVTVPVALEGGPQLVHFGLGQVLPDPVGNVPPAVPSSDWSRYERFGLPKLHDFARHFGPRDDRLIA